jgi:hypothetical protein
VNEFWWYLIAFGAVAALAWTLGYFMGYNGRDRKYK